MKILHTSDWHLGKRPQGRTDNVYSYERYNDFFDSAKHVVEKAIKEKVDLFIISGDLFDSNWIDADILFRTESILSKLRDENIKTLVVIGNHERAYDRESWINYLSKKELIVNLDFSKTNNNFEFTPYIHQGLKIYGISYQGIFTNEILRDLSEDLVDENNLIICHTAINNSETNLFFLPGCVSTDVIDLFAEKTLYFAAGHFHSFQIYPKNNPYFFIPGSLEYWDLYEREPKGFIIFDTDSKVYNFYVSKKRKRSIYSINMSKIDDFINRLFISDGEILLFKIFVDQEKVLQEQPYKNLLKSKGAIHVEFKYEYKNPSDFIIEPSFQISRELIEKQIINSWKNIYSESKENAERTYQFLQLAKSRVLEDPYDSNQNQLFEEFDHFLKQIMNWNT